MSKPDVGTFARTSAVVAKGKLLLSSVFDINRHRGTLASIQENRELETNVGRNTRGCLSTSGWKAGNMASEGIHVHGKATRDLDEGEHVPESSSSSQIYVDDAKLSAAILNLWMSDPPSKTLGLPKLLARLKDREPTWACSERRLRKVRADLLDQDRKPDVEFDSRNPTGSHLAG
ncbi:hypothetical protein P7C70_g6388, partial [Phenoliferia sp. Uapishka_3]